MNRLRKYFFTGIIVLLPLIITVYVLLVILTWITYLDMSVEEGLKWIISGCVVNSS